MANQIVRVNVSDTGQQDTDGFIARNVSISPDGNLVAFLSETESLVADMPTAGFFSLSPGYYYVYNRQTQDIDRVPLEEIAKFADADRRPYVLDRGYQATVESGNVLVQYGNSFVNNHYHYDLETQQIRQVPADDVGNILFSGGGPSTAYSWNSSLTINTGEVNDDLASFYAVDVATGARTILEVPRTEYDRTVVSPGKTSQFREGFNLVAASHDNRYVVVAISVFQSVRTDTSFDTGPFIAVDFGVFDRLANSFTRITNTGPVAVENATTEPVALTFFPRFSISDDGRYVAFSSRENQPAANDTDGEVDVFVLDRVTGITELVSVAPDGSQLNGASSVPDISGDGRYVTFVSKSSAFSNDLFVHDRLTRQTALVNATIDGSDGSVIDSDLTPFEHMQAISSDGRSIVFISEHSKYVLGDTNDRFVKDVFVAHNPLFDARPEPNVAPSDVLFQNVTTGQVYVANMAGGVFLSWGLATGLVGGDWDAIGHGDVNPGATGGAEIFLQQQSTSAISFTSLDTGSITFGTVSNNLSTEWKLRAVADVNGDGSADAIIQNVTTGTIYFGDMQGGAFHGWGVVNAGLTPDWIAVGAGDLNHDGFADVVVQQQGTGTTYYANMANGAFSGWGVVSAMLTADWQARAVGDVNGDGFADVVFQNAIGGDGVLPGTAYFADVSTGTVRWEAVTTKVNADWIVREATDVDDDGFADVLLQNSAGGSGINPGTTYYAHMTTSGFQYWGVVTTGTSPEWTVV